MRGTTGFYNISYSICLDPDIKHVNNQICVPIKAGYINEIKYLMPDSVFVVFTVNSVMCF